MAGERVFLDTNILLYSIDPTMQAAAKRVVAERMLLYPNVVLSVQVLQEFLQQALRARSPFGLTAAEAWRLVSAWRRFPVQENTIALLEHGFAMHRQHHFSWWDSLIVAAAIAQGCTLLYSEDLQDGRIVDRLRIINPFREGAPLP